MDAVEFGSKLVMSGDLDPIYTMLNASNLPDTTLKRWCLAYWMFYHAGVSSLIANAKPAEFWRMVWRAQEEKWPRGTERRHFKAENSRKAIEYLQGTFPVAEDAVTWVSLANYQKLLGAGAPPDRFREILRRAQTWVGFGPWIAFKIADMVDAVLHIPVDFTGSEDTFFDDPIIGAMSIWAQKQGVMLTGQELTQHARGVLILRSRPERAKIAQDTVNLLKAGPLGKLRSPTNPDRPLATQEYETIFCKYKSYLNGHYPMGKDTREILHVLEDERWGPLASKLRNSLMAVTS